MTARGAARAVLAVLAAGAFACARDPLGMVAQPKVRPYAPSDLFQDGRAMRPLVEGTVSQQQPRGAPGVLTGKQDGRELAYYPVTLTRALLDEGRHDFEIYCAACHGYLGDGHSRVGASMALRKPPSLVAHPWAPGHVFAVIGEGYGLMPRYAAEIPPERRWGVAAYVEALRRSRDVPLDRAPPEIRRQLTEGARP